MSPEELAEVKRAFMPPDIPYGGFPVRVVPPGAIKPPPSTTASRERENALAKDAIFLLEQVAKDYARQVDRVWKPEFNNVVAAFATAVERRNNTLKIAEAERQAQANFNAFIFSLLTAGAMRFVGAYVQYAFVPSFKVPVSYKWDMSKGVSVVPKLQIEYGERFSKLQQSAFGGIAQDIGNRAATLIFPKPKQAEYELASWSGVFNLQTDLMKSVDDAAKVVLDRISGWQTWMNNEPEFGAAWMRIADGNMETARALVRSRIEERRKDWAGKWEFFGKSPVAVSRNLLADHYERSLWAGYLGFQLANTMFFDNVAEKSVVNRLKDLNVVFAETDQGKLDQANRMIEGAPRPSMRISGAIDDIDEWGETEIWVFTELKNAPLKSQQFQPEAKWRQLPAL
ncbi:hypothetical protein [Arvimicrobium flavum]|uniref:hypothetical protein n=1 Tax=Arvimicrobium flavum TaxID=3393320 RepID=UPI00237B2EF3|nr:hypothetical protein [Mesorhizobium shangrilense]